MKKAEKKIESMVETMYYSIGYGVQISILDISKVWGAAKQILMAGGGEESAKQAMALAIAQYRKN